MGELVNCLGCGSIISESTPISECITCRAVFQADMQMSRARSRSAPPAPQQQKYTVVIIVIPEEVEQNPMATVERPKGF